MVEFKDLGISAQLKSFEGDKISVESLLDKKIAVLAYRIEESKFKDKGNGRCLHLQIEINGEKRVLFSGSGYLMDMLDQIPKSSIPFLATIKKFGKRLEFT